MNRNELNPFEESFDDSKSDAFSASTTPEAIEAVSAGEVETFSEPEPIIDVDAIIAEDLGQTAASAAKSEKKPQPQKLEFLAFEEAGLNPEVLDTIKNKLGWKAPTPVQALCLPYSLLGRDLAGFAQTGTGKTGVFLISLAERLARKGRAPRGSEQQAKPAAIILAPTRELAIQIGEECSKFLSHLGIHSLSVFGGSSWEEQAAKLQNKIDVIIATPGRLKDYFQKHLVSLNDVEIFVCDEVDRMFDMGFIDDVEFFLSKLSEDCQKLVFSATTNARVKELAFEYLDQPEYISVNPDEIAPEAIEQHALLCETQNKFKLLLGLLRDHDPKSTIIFANTRLTAAWLQYKLKKNGIEAELITGDLPQNKRIALIKRIKAGQIKALVATDVASRGIHIADITHVYNFDIPDEAANYIHRIGRTARAGAKGASYSLVCEEYASNYLAVQELLGEMAPKSVWPDPKYLEVEDKSGNPFESYFGKTQDRQRPERSDPRMERHRGTQPSRFENRGARGRPGEQQQRPSHRQPAAAQASRKASSGISFFSFFKRFFVLLFSWMRGGRKGAKPELGRRSGLDQGHRQHREGGRHGSREGRYTEGQRRSHSQDGRHHQRDRARHSHHDQRSYGRDTQNSRESHRRDFSRNDRYQKGPRRPPRRNHPHE